MNERRLAAAAASTTIVLWASAFVVIRRVGESYSPGAMTFLRLLVGATVLGLLALRRRRSLPRGRTLAVVVGYGVAWFAGYTVVLNWAERHLDAGTAAMLVNVAPLLVAVAAAVLFHDGLPRPVVLGLAVAFAGVTVITVSSDRGGADTLGVVLALAAAVLYAVGVLLQKVALRTVDALTATWVGCAAGLLATAPFAPAAVSDVAAAPVNTTLGVVFLGVGPTAVGFTTWAYALARTDAGRMAATTLAVPAVAVALSWVTLGEIPTLWGLLGGVLCLAGVALSRRRPAAPTVRPDPVAVLADASPLGHQSAGDVGP